MARGDLTEQQWAAIAPHLPPQRSTTGRPAINHRRIINGILWVARTGAPWRDLPKRFGPWQTVASRFYRWRAAGVWERIFAAVQQAADAENQVDWSVHFVDGSIVRAHQHAAGAKKGTRTPKRSVAVRVASQPKSTPVPKDKVSQSALCSRPGNGTKHQSYHACLSKAKSSAQGLVAHAVAHAV